MKQVLFDLKLPSKQSLNFEPCKPVLVDIQRLTFRYSNGFLWRFYTLRQNFSKQLVLI